jgi:hypothetical protein
MFNTTGVEFYFTQCFINMAFRLLVMVVRLGSRSVCVASTAVLANCGPQTSSGHRAMHSYH